MEYIIRRPKTDILEPTVIFVVGNRLYIRYRSHTNFWKYMVCVCGGFHDDNENKNYEERKCAGCTIVLVKSIELGIVLSL